MYNTNYSHIQYLLKKTHLCKKNKKILNIFQSSIEIHLYSVYLLLTFTEGRLTSNLSSTVNLLSTGVVSSSVF